MMVAYAAAFTLKARARGEVTRGNSSSWISPAAWVMVVAHASRRLSKFQRGTDWAPSTRPHWLLKPAVVAGATQVAVKRLPKVRPDAQRKENEVSNTLARLGRRVQVPSLKPVPPPTMLALSLPLAQMVSGRTQPFEHMRALSPV